MKTYKEKRLEEFDKLLIKFGRDTLLSKEEAKQFLSETIDESDNRVIKKIKKDLNVGWKKLYDELRDEYVDDYSIDYKGGILRGYVIILRFLESLSHKEKK